MSRRTTPEFSTPDSLGRDPPMFTSLMMKRSKLSLAEQHPPSLKRASSHFTALECTETLPVSKHFFRQGSFSRSPARRDWTRLARFSRKTHGFPPQEMTWWEVKAGNCSI